MVGKAKHHPEEEPSLCIVRDKFEMRVGSKVEAMDYLGNW